MSNINFTPAKDTLKTILGNGKYYFVPKFQRNYSWESEQCEDLWLDIMDLWNDNDQHYMGNMVFKSVADSTEEFEIIDGQQRITTLSLLIHAIVQYLIDNNEVDLAENIKKEYLVRRRPGSSEYNTTKLKLNEVNNSFYIRLNASKTGLSSKSENESNKLLLNAYSFFYRKIEEEFKLKDVKKIDEFLNYFSTNLIFIHITSDTDDKVYSIFETLNSRGLPLSSVDLIKNYIFGIADDEQTRSYWDNIVNTLDSDLFPFIRHYLNIKNGDGSVIRVKNTFKLFKKNYRTPEQILNFLIDANLYAPFYSALSDQYSEIWKDFDDKTVTKNIAELSLFRATQFKLIALSIYIYQPSLFTQIIKIISNITFRYSTICGKNPNSLETIYSKIAYSLAKGDITNISEIKQSLRDVYISDDEFVATFEEKDLIYSNRKQKKLISYILWQIECQLKNKQLSYDLIDSSSTIEHILPENPDDSWSFDQNKINSSKKRLGNFTLLESSKNKDASNSPFEIKRNIYSESVYEITKLIPKKYTNWTFDELISRQKDLAKYAKTVWRVDF
jgi:uncharacterized protein with ParB-like and HNH nuclease domain